MYPEAPPRVEYSLTKSGEAMTDILNNLLQWADGHMAKLNAGDHEETGSCY
ncbi:MAG TPA: winged helix-turn-helix transcriptional regulator [Bacillota bacterium]|nr:winged helix-turn-helix transcriptional regulator [Bacillota bacterium]